ncbi:CoA-binding protein (plasmid) [Legionella adelaidensis]|uniref:CoA-binding protein n=1 Tax=Legionella adelaidensis TaxID=45056 RepID=A0A0W0R5Y0_9GAMM|nr:CoA-binding protein [Legionella adelaidensis]KTC66442.1 CoA-binding protein [Legionella adelaidensis]VEH86270.1 CoA-binding protein [Legionella adelaidensis]
MGISIHDGIEKFFESSAFAVVGASPKRDKYGNKVLRCYMQNGLTAYPINPIHKEIEGLACYKNVSELPDTVQSISIITPSQVTEKVVIEAIKKGIKNIWMQPGAESDQAIKDCEINGVNVLARGPCILVVLGFKN